VKQKGYWGVKRIKILYIYTYEETIMSPPNTVCKRGEGIEV
jgi:hypothetical protein